MRADYDSAADAISISITDDPHADASDEVHPRAIVGLDRGRPVGLQLLYPQLGTAEPLQAVATRYDLGRQELEAVVQSALAAPDRVVSVEVAARARA